MCDLDDTIFYLWKVIWGQECNFTHQLVHFQWCFSFHPQCNVKVLIRLLPRGGMKSNEFWIDFYRIFRTIFHLSNQSNHKFSNRIERISNESSYWKIWLHPIVGVESNRTNFELIFIKFFKCFLPFRINRIANYWIERISKRIPILLHP